MTRFTLRLVLAAAITVAPALTTLAQEAAADEGLTALVSVLETTEDTQFQLDVLKGMNAALQGRRNVPMPQGWPPVEEKLARSNNTEVRDLARSLGLAFGSQTALEATRATLLDPDAAPASRRAALDALLSARDPELPDALLKLLEDGSLRGQAIRALASFDHPQAPVGILSAYPNLTGAEKKDALNTLGARASYAEALLNAVKQEHVPRRDITAELVRQLRTLDSPVVTDALAEVWGIARQTGADKKQEIEKFKRVYRAGGSQPGDAMRGRAVYTRICHQCHLLFGTGGEVGPDLTGSNRADLDYLLENMIDPNAVIPNDYRTSTLETTDDRVLTGIIKRDVPTTVTIQTANDTVIVPREEIHSMRQSELSMMPEGLLQLLPEQEVRDLIYYLSRPSQVPLPATDDTVHHFFNGDDLANWEGDLDLWRVENGEIIGLAETGLQNNEFLKSQLVFGDFRLVCEVKLVPNTGNSGIQFRSQPEPSGSVKGYQADAGAGWWGKLYEEHGRALLWDKSGESFVRPGEWNTYEIVAVGPRILTAINGGKCVDLTDPEGARSGIIAFQLHSCGPMEVRFRNFKIDLNPAPELRTLQQ